MNFLARLRKQGESLIITIPNEVVEALNLKSEEIVQFGIEVRVSQESTTESQEKGVKSDFGDKFKVEEKKEG